MTERNDEVGVRQHTHRGGASGSDDAENTTGASMSARTWVIAYRYREPADYDIPELPEWSTTRTDGGGLALAARDGDEPFVRAERPVRVRR